jgi:transposase
MSEYYLGIDLHKRRSYVVLMDTQGKVISEGGLSNDDMSEHLREKVPHDTVAVIEATWNWQFMHDLLSEQCAQVLLAHPQKVKMIAEATVKTDKIDAHTLAHLARTGYLPIAYAAPREIRELRQIARHRSKLVADRTRHKNRIHATLARRNIHSPFSDLFGCKGREFLTEVADGRLSQIDQQVIDNNLTAIDLLNQLVDAAEIIMADQTINDTKVSLLKTIPGVGLITAVTIRAELGEVERFSSADRAARWAGLTPKVHVSDETVRHGSISRQGSPYLREAMVGAALRAIRYSPRLRSFYHRIAKRRGSGMARVALGRKMLLIAYTMLMRDEPYREDYRENHQGA